MAFNPGDMVKLKSGSPIMTVQKVINENVHVSWYEDKKGMQNGMFKAASLVASDGMPPLPMLVR